jgi:hypothetical protein
MSYLIVLPNTEEIGKEAKGLKYQLEYIHIANVKRHKKHMNLSYFFSFQKDSTSVKCYGLRRDG